MSEGLGLTALLEDIHRSKEEEFNRASGVAGWSMRDLPRLASDMFDDLLDRIGRDDVRVVVGSTGNTAYDPDVIDRQSGKQGKFVECEPWVRATILISPAGMQRLRESTAEPTGDVP